MSELDVELDTRPSSQVKVEAWRELCLLDAGYSPQQSEHLASLRHVDLHEAVALLRRGCPVATAYEILL